MSLGTNPLALFAATISLGAHVAIFGSLLAGPAEEPPDLVHLVDIVTAPSPPSSPASRTLTPSIAPAALQTPTRTRTAADSERTRRTNVPAQSAPLPLPAPVTAARSSGEPQGAASSTEAPAPTPPSTALATPRSRPASRAPDRHATTAADPVQTASLGRDPTRRPMSPAAVSIETGIAVASGNAQPRYPLIARKRGYEGRAIIRASVSERGRVLSATVAESSGHDVLDQAARRAVSGWAFQPGQRDGRPIAGRIDVPVEFRLR